MFLEYLEDNNKRFFNIFKNPMIVEMSIESGEVLRFKQLPGDTGQVGTYIKCFKYEDKIVSIPLHSDCFAIWDLKKNEIKSIDIPQKKMSKEQYGFFSMAVQEGQFIYAFGINYPGIVRINMVDEKAKCICNLKSSNISDVGFIGEMVLLDNKVYIPLLNSSKFILFDKKTEELQFVDAHIGNDKSVKTVFYDGDKIWFITEHGDVYTTDKNIKNTIKIDKLSRVLSNSSTISHGTYYNGNVFLFPQNGNKYLQYDVKNMSEKWVEALSGNPQNCFYYVKNEGKKLLFYCEDYNLIYEFNDENNKFEISKKQLSAEKYFDFIKKVEGNIFVKENQLISIEAFIKKFS